jgi:toxin ParE1/3/4
MGVPTLLVHPAAEREMTHAVAWARDHFGPIAASRLRARIIEAGELLLREPALGTLATSQTRRLPLTGYPYTLVYRARGDLVHVLAFMHQSRLPDYWLHRS